MTGQGENAVRQRLRYRPDSDITVELSWHGITDVGLRRESNQDSYVLAPPLFAVADGMGGHAAGEVASGAVTRRLFELSGMAEITTEQLVDRLVAAVSDIETEAGEAAVGAGTTLSGMMFGSDPENATWTVFNIGDSRVYQYFKGSLQQITSDHSVVQHLLDTGAITPEEAEIHPHANVITRAVGCNEDPVPEIVQLALIPGQRLLICSDGLTKELTDLGIQHFLAEAETAKEAAEMLIAESLGNAGRDNITVVVVEVHAVGDVRDTADLHTLADRALVQEITGEVKLDKLDKADTAEKPAAGATEAEPAEPVEPESLSGDETEPGNA
ncbi:MAG: protein phosphatase 2C domain-containing protein [Microbacteriaceae bacterium]|nr:protein phosphatase 2C domain-containing protein [Microbacteriaceae bacterium]